MYMNVESISGKCSRTLIQSNVYMNVESISGNVVGH